MIKVLPIVVGALGTVPKNLEEDAKESKNYRKNRCITVEIREDTKKNPGALKRLAVSRTFEKNHHLKRVRKSRKD